MAGEKRSQEREDAQRTEKIILIDIEGTTTSISFVKETLFPYVRTNLKDYIEKNWENAEFKEDFEKLKEQAKKDEADKIEGVVAIAGATPVEEKESLVKNVIWQMDNDRKSGALKQLQGHMWREAYKSGDVKGHVYEDVPKALEAWTKEGRKVYVYSSGSVEAQKLLFGHSESGDLLKYLTDYFDTEVGVKQESSSYKNILSKIEAEAKNVLFLTDIPKEAKAAVDAGMASVIVIREGNADLTADEKSKYSTIRSFEDLVFQNSVKRQKLDEPSKPEKEEEKKIEPVKAAVVEPMDTTDDVEMADVSEKKVEKEVESKTIVEVKKTETKPIEEPTKVEVKKDSPAESEKKIEKITEPEKNGKTDEEPIVKASTSEEEKMETDSVKKEAAEPLKVAETKVDEKTEVQTKSVTSPKVTEVKTDKVEKVSKESVAVEVKESKPEIESVEKVKPEKKTDSEAPKKEENSNKKVEEKTAETVVEPTKTEEKKPEEKPVVEEVKQNGDSKATVSKESIPETKVTNGQKAEMNGNSKVAAEPVTEEKKEAEKPAETIKTDDAKAEVDVKAEPVKEDEKKKDQVEKKVNGNSGETEEKAHRNGVNEEKSKNGETSTETDSIKVKKVVETIADGAAEPDVVSPVAVVAATS